MATHIAVFGETMVFFMRGNSCQLWVSSTGFFDSGDMDQPHARVYGLQLTLRELEEDEHGGGRSESNSHQLGELVVRKVLSQLRRHIFWLFFVSKDRCEGIVAGVVQYRAQELRANVAEEENRSEGE